MMEVVNRVQRAERDLTAELGRMPTPEEVALRSSLTVEKLLDIMQLAIPTTSLDAPVGYNTDDLTVGDTIANTDENDPISSTERSQLREAVERTLKDLPEREQEIVAMRFGIGHFDRIYTLEEVADKMKVTRERVRQIEQKTLARLRHPHSNNNLRSFLDEE
jgi:RNA polymerase primary sigma factor